MHINAYAWSRARGRIYMHNASHVCMYECICMRFTLHSELRAYPSYGHPPRRRCPDKGGLSVPWKLASRTIIDHGKFRDEPVFSGWWCGCISLMFIWPIACSFAYQVLFVAVQIGCQEKGGGGGGGLENISQLYTKAAMRPPRPVN